MIEEEDGSAVEAEEVQEDEGNVVTAMIMLGTFTTETTFI